MDAREWILSELRNYCRQHPARAELDGFTWEDTQFLRLAILRLQDGEDTAWQDFIQLLTDRPELASNVRWELERAGFIYHDPEKDVLMLGLFPPEVAPMPAADEDAFIRCFSFTSSKPEKPDQLPQPQQHARSRIMYLELKSGSGDRGNARIGRVTFSGSGKTIYYQGRSFQSSKGRGIGANYFDVASGDEYWISGPKKNGQDRHWAGGGPVSIDPDVADEYWSDVRKCAPPKNPLIA